MAKTSTAVATIQPQERAGLLATFGARYNIDAGKVATVLKQTCFRTEKPASDEQMMALLVVANEYKLNPFTREIYAFEDKHKGIVPIVPIDGWVTLINRHPELQALAFEYGEDEDAGPWIECIIERKDRTRPIQIREYLNECRRDTAPWRSHPRRMLRHKALIQAGRVAFGLHGIFDEDEGERIAMAIDVTPRGKPATVAPKALELKPASEMPWQEATAAAAEKAPAGAVLDEAKSRALDAQLAAEESSGE